MVMKNFSGMEGKAVINIAIVDDENKVCSSIERILLKLSGEQGIRVDIDVFYSGEELITEFESKFFDVIFLDIKLKKLSGIDVSRLIRGTMKNEITQIIYISGNTEYAVEVFDYDPFYFVPKPVTDEQIEKVFLKLIRKLNLKTEAFVYNVGHKSFKVSVKDIIYFENSKREIIIHCVDKEDRFYGSMEGMVSQLSRYGFLLIHKSYLINTVHIRKYTYENVEMSNHVILPIAQSKRKEIREQRLETIRNEEI